MERISLYDEYRLIERNESEVNSAWKGVHLLLFFLAFVFGSFCTFCFHMLMDLFDENCVMFPRMRSLTDSKHGIIYDFLPDKETDKSGMPVDFLSTLWMDKSVCYVPTYVPLLSGIFGLVWTTMFLMCSSSNQTLTGLQRSWRILPAIFLFSLGMGALCVYSSMLTYDGLMDLCVKLGEITGTNSSCSYTINVATLAYERRIRGIYQAVRLTILSAWMHTCCWLMSAVVALVRVILVVDFRLVRVKVELQGDIDKMLERQEQHIRTVSPDVWIRDETTNTPFNAATSSNTSIRIHFKNKTFNTPPPKSTEAKTVTSAHYFAPVSEVPIQSMESLVPEERRKLEMLAPYQAVDKEHRFLVRLLYDIIDDVLDDTNDIRLHIRSSESIYMSEESADELTRTRGGRDIAFGKKKQVTIENQEPVGESVAEIIANDIRRELIKKIDGKVQENPIIYDISSTLTPVSSSTPETTYGSLPGSSYISTLNITEEMEQTIERHKNEPESYKRRRSTKKSNLKNKETQTESKERLKAPQKVQIDEIPRTTDTESEVTLKPESEEKSPDTQSQVSKDDKETQSTSNKEKQD